MSKQSAAIKKNPEWDTKEWRDIKREVFHRDNYHCVRCDKRFDSGYLTGHHLIPRSEGGSNAIDNLITLCWDCHNIAEIYGLRTRVDVIGSMPDPPPARNEWIEVVNQEQDEVIRIGDSMAQYGILFDDNHHCLRCGIYSSNLARFTMTYNFEGVSVLGFAYLCQACFVKVRIQAPQSILEIVPPPRRNMVKSDKSPYVEILDPDYFDLFQRPAWLRRQD